MALKRQYHYYATSISLKGLQYTRNDSRRIATFPCSLYYRECGRHTTLHKSKSENQSQKMHIKRFKLNICVIRIDPNLAY